MQRVLRRIISWAVELTPGVHYYSSDLDTWVNGELQRTSLKQGSGGYSLASSTLCLAIAVSNEMKPGDTFKTTIYSAKSGDKVVGSYRVTVERLEDEE